MKLFEIQENISLFHDASGDNVFFKLKRLLVTLRRNAYTEYIENQNETRDVSATSSLFFLILSAISVSLVAPIWLSASLSMLTAVSVGACLRSSFLVQAARKARSGQSEFGSVCETAFSQEDRYLIRNIIELHFREFSVEQSYKIKFSEKLDQLLSEMPDISRVSIRTLLTDLKTLEQSIETKDSLEKLKKDLHSELPVTNGLAKHLREIQTQLQETITFIEGKLESINDELIQEEQRLVESYNDFCKERECVCQIVDWEQHDKAAVMDEIIRLKKVLGFLKTSSKSSVPVQESLKRTHFCHDVLEDRIPVDTEKLRKKIDEQLAALECVYSS